MSAGRKFTIAGFQMLDRSWKILGITMLLAASPAALAQKAGFSVSVGVASQRMDDLKYIQEYILSTYPLEGRITSSFPPFSRVSFNLVRQWYDYLKYGGGYTFSTTGAKSSYADYTGFIATEISPTSHRLGGFISYSLLGREHIGLSLYGRADVNLSTVSIESTINLLGLVNRIRNQYRSISPSGTAGMELMYNFEGFALGLDAGYLVDLQGSLRDTDGDEDLTDPFDRNRILTTDWTGWHVGIRARVWLNF
jgi:hypothetical protein